MATFVKSTGGNSTLPYDEYVSSINQTDTDAPTVNHAVNGLGGNPAYTRTGVGLYKLTITGKFIEGKTYPYILTTNDATANRAIGIMRLNENEMLITSGAMDSGTAQDNFIEQVTIIIRVYK